MARCIDLFIDVAETDSGGVLPPGGAVRLESVAQLAAQLTSLTGLRLSEQPATGTWVATVDGARVELAGRPRDDHRLAVSTYRYDLFARVPPADAQNSPEAALLRRILGLVKADGRYRAMLVWDLQNVVDTGADAGAGGRGGDSSGGVAVDDPAGVTSGG